MQKGVDTRSHVMPAPTSKPMATPTAGNAANPLDTHVTPRRLISNSTPSKPSSAEKIAAKQNTPFKSATKTKTTSTPRRYSPAQLQKEGAAEAEPFTSPAESVSSFVSAQPHVLDNENVDK